MDVEFIQDVSDVGFDGIGRDREAFSNLCIGQVKPDERRYFPFAPGELLPGLQAIRGELMIMQGVANEFIGYLADGTAVLFCNAVNGMEHFRP